MSGTPILEQVEITLINKNKDNKHTVYLDIYNNSLSRKWLQSLNHLLKNNYHLEKNYCFFGFVGNERDPEYICNQINQSIEAINSADLGYQIDDFFTVANTISSGPIGDYLPGYKLIHSKTNNLHRYFEDLQGVSGNMADYYQRASSEIRWHIRQLNLLCHEYESLMLSLRKEKYAPEWQRPSQLMCWLNAPRFDLDEEDYELFGINTINRSLGGVYVGVNKAVGKHHWEVFNDEGRDSRVNELTTTTLRSQTEAAGDFDIEWGQDPGKFAWQQQRLDEFKQWLVDNNFDPENRALTIGHPKIGQVDLLRSFDTEDHMAIWSVLNNYLDVYSIKTSTAQATYLYHWSDANFIDLQVTRIQQGN